MERAVEVLAAIHLLIVGLSHMLQPRAWVDFFIWLRERGRPGIFVHGFLSLGFGSIILAFHPVWSGLPLLLTILGCLYLVKATLCFVVPATQERSLARVAPERAREMVGVGVVYVAIAGVLAWSLWLR